MKRFMMKSGLIGIVLGVGFGYSASNPCTSDFSSYQLRSLGRAEAHRIGSPDSEISGAPSVSAVQGDVYRLRAMGRAEARRILTVNANEPTAPLDYGRIYRLRALGRAEARYIDSVKCEESSN